MKCRENAPKMRTFLFRALSFSAVAALMLDPALTPAVAADTPPVIAGTDAKMRFLALGIGKSVVIDLPREVKDVLVADPQHDVRAHLGGGVRHTSGDRLGIGPAAAFRLSIGHMPLPMVQRGRQVVVVIAAGWPGAVADQEPLGRQLAAGGVRDDVGAVAVREDDHVGGSHGRGGRHVRQVRERAHPHRVPGDRG